MLGVDLWDFGCGGVFDVEMGGGCRLGGEVIVGFVGFVGGVGWKDNDLWGVVW